MTRYKTPPNGVEIILQCDDSVADGFIDNMKSKLPPLASIETIEKTVCQTENNFTDFNILETQQGNSITKVPADTAICDLCLDDIFNPQSRYYLYSYISYIHYGPRFSTIQSLPYDRDKPPMLIFHYVMTVKSVIQILYIDITMLKPLHTINA